MSDIFEINALLLVEDSIDDVLITQRKLFKSTLKINNFYVANNLNEAIDIIHKHDIDIVLLDLNLPEAKSIDTLVKFKAEYSGVIIVVTSIDNELVGIEAIRKGADDYIVKNTLTESIISKSVLWARERHNMKAQIELMNDKINSLDKLSGVQ